MIRQAISCDICGAEKKQTNHWFVAYTHAGELRGSGWGTQGKIRAGSKHLCGQTCLHKLVDEFIAGGATSKAHAPTQEAGTGEEPMAAADTSLTCSAAYMKPVSSPTGLPAPAMPAAVIAIAPPQAIQEPRLPTVAPMVEMLRTFRRAAGERRPGSANGNASAIPALGAGARVHRSKKISEPILSRVG
jgi:hypothetical protein